MDVNNNDNNGIVLYANLLSDIKTRIRQTQVKATLSANAEMIMMYWDIGRIIHKRQQQEGWGAGIIPRLAKDLHNELPDLKGFSERNIKFMVQLYKEYETDTAIGKQPVSQLEDMKRLVSQIPWGHNILLMQKIKDISLRFWYMAQIIQNGWSRDTLGLMIKSKIHERHGKSITNFRFTLPNPQSDLARQSLKDPYIFDFLTLAEPFNERELETELIKHLLKHPTDPATIGLILCQTKDRILAEYALWDLNKPIGISEYELTRALPENLKSSLPSIEELEAELGEIYQEESGDE
jgi:predicted nuclease of restriction endonuclease-like (RecB) superfamily